MDYGTYMNRRLHGWGFAKMHASPSTRPPREEFASRQSNSVHVEDVSLLQRTGRSSGTGDAHGYEFGVLGRILSTGCYFALNIEDRYLSGESHPSEGPDGDDSAADRARLTALQDSQADVGTQQTTLGTYAS